MLSNNFLALLNFSSFKSTHIKYSSSHFATMSIAIVYCRYRGMCEPVRTMYARYSCPMYDCEMSPTLNSIEPRADRDPSLRERADKDRAPSFLVARAVWRADLVATTALLEIAANGSCGLCVQLFDDMLLSNSLAPLDDAIGDFLT